MHRRTGLHLLFSLALSGNLAPRVGGTLIYRFQERFKENKKHRVTLELDPVRHPLVRFLRVEGGRYDETNRRHRACGVAPEKKEESPPRSPH